MKERGLRKTLTGTVVSDAMEKIAFDEKLRQELIVRGRVRRNEFSWQKSADKLWASMEKVLVIK